MRKKISFRQFDFFLFATPVLIFMVGLLSIYSASHQSGQTLDESLAVRQILWMAVGIAFVFLMVRIDYFKFQDIAWPSYIVSVFFLLAVLFTPARLGAHRWISLGGFNFQPSEFAKLAVILVLSQFFSENRLEYISWEKKSFIFLIVALPFLLILKEPDLGTALTLIPILIAMLYLWGIKLKEVFILIGLGLLAVPLCFGILKDYQKARLLVFMNPSLDPLGAGYTIIQSKIAIGSGGFFGKGFMAGTQNQLQFIPEKHTDFIFPVIAEEGGFVAATVVLGLFFLIIKKGFQICAVTPDRFGSQLACGISMMLAMQVLINIGMTMGVLPVVGMPLPLVSYGGSSVVMTMISIGFLLNIKMHRPLF